MLSFNYFPLITRPTRINNNVNRIIPFSLVDHMWCNFNHNLCHMSAVIKTTISDHYPILYVFKSKLNNVIKRIKFRKINNNSINDFVNTVNNECFSNIYEIDNVDEAFTCFYNKLFSIYNVTCPVKKKRIRESKICNPSVTFKLKKCIKKKYRLYNLLRRGLIDKSYYNKYKKVLTIVTNKMRRLYYLKKFQNVNSMKESWNNINSFLNRKRSENPTKIINNSGQVLTGTVLVEAFNEYFSNIGNEIAASFSRVIDFNFFNIIPSVPHSCVFVPCSSNEIKHVIDGLNNKGNCLFDIRGNLLKRLSDVLSPILCYLYNKCLNDGIYPTVLKVARVVPIFKSGCHTSINNYRPISNLSTINKIFEILTYNRMVSFINNFHLISKFQHGFMRDSSTTLAIFRFVNDVLKAMNNKRFVIALFLDLRKAFDTVDHGILMHKMQLFGFRGVVNKFISSYLNNRKQFVNIDHYVSRNLDINIGVPQGSVLGPLFFNIFFNDLVLIDDCEMILFADDAVIYVSDINLQLCINKVNNLVKRLNVWLGHNKLTPNISKTKLMLFSVKQPNILPDIYFSGEKLEWVHEFRYLGITIDNRLTFKSHCRSVLNKLSSAHGTFWAVSAFFPKYILMKIFYSIAYPIITQNIILWGGCYPSYLTNIKTTLNKILRCILKAHDLNYDYRPLVRTNTLYINLNVLKLQDIYKYFLLKFVHFCFYRRFDIFLEYFSNLLPIHNYNTRNIKINLPIVRLDIEKQFVLYKSCELINEIDDSFLIEQSSIRLKKSFKAKCIESY